MVYDFKWKGRVRIKKNTRGDGTEFYTAAVRVKANDVWWFLRTRDPQIGSDVVCEYATGQEAMRDGQRVWTMNQGKAIVKSTVVF